MRVGWMLAAALFAAGAGGFGNSARGEPDRAEPEGASALRIATMVARTGPRAGLGADVMDGLALAIAEAGDRVAGRPLRIVPMDTTGEPAAVLAAAKHLVEVEGAELIVGALNSTEAVALRDFAHASKVPLVVAGAVATALSHDKCSPYVVRVSFGNDQLSGTLARWAAGESRVKRAYLIGTDTDAGADMIESFAQAFTEAGGEVVGRKTVPTDVRDFAAHVAKLKLVGADGVFAYFRGEAAREFLSAYRELGLSGGKGKPAAKPLLMPLVAGVTGPDVLEGAIAVTNFLPDSDVPQTRAFARAFFSRYGRVPSAFAAYGYDAGRLVLAAAESTGGSTSDREAFSNALRAASFAGARGSVWVDPATNTLVQDVFVVETQAEPAALSYRVLARRRAVAAEGEGCRN